MSRTKTKAAPLKVPDDEFEVPPTKTLHETQRLTRSKSRELTQRVQENTATFQFDEPELVGPPGGKQVFVRTHTESIREKRIREAKESEARFQASKKDSVKKTLKHKIETPDLNASISEHAEKKVAFLKAHRKWKLFKGGAGKIIFSNVGKLMSKFNWKTALSGGPIAGVLGGAADAAAGAVSDTIGAGYAYATGTKLKKAEEDTAALALLASRAAATIEQFHESGVHMCSVSEAAKILDLVLQRLSKYQQDEEGKGEVLAGADLRSKISADTMLLMSALAVMDNEMASINAELDAAKLIPNAYEREEAIAKIFNRKCTVSE